MGRISQLQSKWNLKMIESDYYYLFKFYKWNIMVLLISKLPGEKGILLTILQTLLSLKRYDGDGRTNARSGWVVTDFCFFLYVLNAKVMKVIEQCWIGDGSWPVAYIMQIRCANHPKVLYSKGMVLSVWAKRCLKASGKCNEAESKWTVYLRCRKT